METTKLPGVMTRPLMRLFIIMDKVPATLIGVLPKVLGDMTTLVSTSDNAELMHKVIAGLFVAAMKFEETVHTELLHIAVDLSPPAVYYALYGVAAKIIEDKMVETETTHEDLERTGNAITGPLLEFGLRPEVLTDLLGIAQGIKQWT
ncbi:unnamed protein product [Zymoseptoria tritici ST99CH_1E4]|uniref:Uncharacterized protein n=1 Tax=Zymoseptoria tritici ST99CH_1E4 TaxID=1276532 RepID=A0A2H1GF70_ZYMTR|nr:unnamed protein product [Zymoseptoria tritici ST99CH_1E4]